MFFKPLRSLALIVTLANSAGALTLHNDTWSVSVDPATLSLSSPSLNLPLSSSQPDLGHVAELSSTDTSAAWTYPDKHLAVSFKLEGATLIARFTADAPSAFTFPSVPADPTCSTYILPFFEGVHVPADDADWVKRLSAQDPVDTTADLSMPFWGIQTAAHTVTFLLPNPFNNALAFHDDHGRLAASLTHTFRKNWAVKEYSVRITLGGPSPVAPAMVYRQYLKETHQFVSLADKIGTLPDVAKLIGAVHVYLWGGGRIAAGDIPDFKAFAAEVMRQAKEGPKGSPGRRLFGLLKPEVQKIVASLPNAAFVDNYLKSQVVEDLSRVILRDDLPPKALAEAFPTVLHPVETWGDGVSPKMIRTMVAAGLDRVRAVVPDVKDLRDNADTIVAAKAAGYLIGPYDSFHTIHSPKEADTDDTSQFDQHLYETGAIINENGKPSPGFQHKGYHLSPIAAKAAVEARVTAWQKQTPCNCWFVDCDAFGEVYDDFSPLHPATAKQDMEARLARLAWIRNTFHAVLGSEGGSSFAAGVIDFSEGPETPVIGWGDPDLAKDKSSPYYLGAYYPPNQPTVFFKPVPLKPAYYKFYFDPRYRLPLYQTALHDSVVATHHWTYDSFKLKDQTQTRELLELLYAVPPLYHLNVSEFAKRKEAILAHYAVFSPLHRETALLPMTDFAYLTPDHLLQRTTFGDHVVEVVANFSTAAQSYKEHALPPRSVSTFHADNVVKTYQPQP